MKIVLDYISYDGAEWVISDHKSDGDDLPVRISVNGESGFYTVEDARTIVEALSKFLPDKEDSDDYENIIAKYR